MSNTKTLFNLFQKIDYRDKENSGKKKLTGILIAYLVSNTALSFNFYTAFDERSFVILSMTSSLFLISIIVLNDFDNLFLAGRNYEILNMLPVKSSEFFRAKFLSAILFLLFFILASVIPQVVFFYNIDHNILRAISFVLTIILFSYFATGILIFLYVIILIYFREKAVLMLNFLQIFFFVFIFYSSTLSSRAASKISGNLVKHNILNFGITKYLPQTFFSNSVYDIFYFLICLLASASVFVLLYFFISGKYFLILENAGSIKKKSTFSKAGMKFTFINNLIYKYILTNNYEAASYNLIKNQLRNSKFLRIKYIPILFMPLMFVIIGVVSDSRNLLFFNEGVSSDSFFKTSILLISPTITMTLMMCSRLLISNSKILDDISSNTEWIYDSLPVTKRSFIIKGTNKFIYLVFLFPIIILITLLLNLKADFSTVMMNILFIVSGIYFISSVALLFDKTFPFTLESSKFNSASKFIEVFLAMFLGVILFLIQIFVFQNTIFVIISILVFTILSLLLNRN